MDGRGKFGKYKVSGFFLVFLLCFPKEEHGAQIINQLPNLFPSEGPVDITPGHKLCALLQVSAPQLPGSHHLSHILGFVDHAHLILHNLKKMHS